ncbi:hypothetical protein ABW19_dt0206932 [Dactylella cylindrospora]|nr:hypothetical protein ABW19_dt0206932 [Dactylella cylindrospora]
MQLFREQFLRTASAALRAVSTPSAVVANKGIRHIFTTATRNRLATPQISHKSFLIPLPIQTRAMSSKSDKPEPTSEELLERVKSSNFGLARKLQVEAIEKWAKDINDDLTPIHATLTPNPTLTFTFPVHKKYCNLAGNLHGGATATMFDIATTFAVTLINSDTFWRTFGVSRTLNCTYLRAAPAGTQTTVKCEILSIGKNLTHMRGEMRDEQGRLLAICEHGKVNVDSKL